MALPQGTRLGTYEIISALAAGGMGEVYRARDPAGGPMRRITDFGHEATFITRRVSWSPDGHSIYAAVGKGEADIVLLSNLKP